MKAVVIRTFGAPEGLEVVDLPVPAPGPGQVRVATEAIGVGGVDAVIRRATIGGLGLKEGHLLGSEVAGVVEAVGEGVDASWKGRRVWAFTGLTGGYAERAVAAVEDVLPLPEGLTPAQAVTLGGSAVVAHFALERARFAPGESVLVRGAAGSIGIAAVQLAAQGERARWRSPPPRRSAADGCATWAPPTSSTARAGAARTRPRASTW